MRCSVVGATGYTGSELVKLLAKHPYVSIASLTTRQKEPFDIRRYVPELPKSSSLTLEPYDFDTVEQASDVVFLALPHTTAAETVAKFIARKKIVIDLSADFRLKRVGDYKRWYGHKHPAPALARKAVYGLPESHREEIRRADLIANPGCYPTGSILALRPLLANRLIDETSIVVDAKSGVSGAGRKLSEATQFCEANENLSAYKINRHQHMPEIEQELSMAAKKAVHITFVPHLLPVARGILTAAYARKKKGVTASSIVKAFDEAYRHEPFVRFLGEGTFPSLRNVQFTNYCDIGVSVDGRSGQIIVISAIDNLLKGASGQAIQNMNIRLGYAEESGLV